MIPATPDAGLAWERVLDRLEADLLEAETLARTGQYAGAGEPWAPPTAAGPLPAHLVARARALRARQREAIARLGGALSDVRQQRAVAARVDRATGRTRGSVYVDRTA